MAGLSSVLDDDEHGGSSGDETEEHSIGHGGAGGCAYAVSAPERIDKMYKIKAELVDLQTLSDLKFQTFCKHFGLAGHTEAPAGKHATPPSIDELSKYFRRG